MKKLLKTVLYLMLVLLSLFILMIAVIYKQTEIPKEECGLASGIVKDVTEGGVKDVVFELQNDKISYYINRGLENGLTLTDLRSDLMGKKIAIYFSDAWTPFAPFGTRCKHIRQIEIEGAIVYTEIDSLLSNKNIIPKTN